MDSKKEYVIQQLVSPFTGAPLGSSTVIHKNLVGPGVGRTPCPGIVDSYTYADAAHRARHVVLTQCKVCGHFHT